MHKLYDFDAVLADLKSLTKAELPGAMQGHVLAQAELIGTYESRLGTNSGNRSTPEPSAIFDD